MTIGIRASRAASTASATFLYPRSRATTTANPSGRSRAGAVCDGGDRFDRRVHHDRVESVGGTDPVARHDGVRHERPGPAHRLEVAAAQERRGHPEPGASDQTEPEVVVGGRVQPPRRAVHVHDVRDLEAEAVRPSAARHESDVAAAPPSCAPRSTAAPAASARPAWRAGPGSSPARRARGTSSNVDSGRYASVTTGARTNRRPLGDHALGTADLHEVVVCEDDVGIIVPLAVEAGTAEPDRVCLTSGRATASEARLRKSGLRHLTRAGRHLLRIATSTNPTTRSCPELGRTAAAGDRAVSDPPTRPRSRRHPCGGSSGTSATPSGRAGPGSGSRTRPSRTAARSATTAGRSTSGRSSCPARA